MSTIKNKNTADIPWVSSLPNGWCIVRLKNICVLNYGDSLSDEKRMDGEVPVYGSNGIVGRHNVAITTAPCIIVGRKGSYGKINYSTEPCFPIDTTYWTDTYSTNTDLRWLSYLLPLLELDINSQDSAVPGLSREVAYEKRLPLPPSDEQRRIAAYLDEQTAKIDRLINLRQRQMALLKEQRAALIQQAVTRGLNPNVPMKDSGLPWLGEIPKHWEMKRLKYLCSLLRDGTHQPPKRVEVGYPLLSVRNIQEGIFTRRDDDSMISEEDFKALNQSFVVKAGDLLMAIVGATLGKVAIVPDMDQFQIQRSLAILRPRLEVVHKNFLCFLIECKAFQKCLWSNVGFSAQPGIYLSTVGDLGCPLPSLREQTQILEFIQYECQRIDSLLSAYIHQLELLREYRAALIHECVTGQRVVPDHFLIPAGG